MTQQTISTLHVFDRFYIEFEYSQSASGDNAISIGNDNLQFWLLGICSWNYFSGLDLQYD